MHQPHRLFRAPAAWAGDARNGDGEIGRAMPRRRCAIASAVSRLTAPWRSRTAARHPQHRLLGGIRIGDEAAVDHVRGAGNFGQRRGDQSSGAGFGGRDHKPAAATGVQDACRRQRARSSPIGAHGDPVRQTDRRRRDRRDAFAAAEEAELLVGRGLDGDAVDADAGDLGDPGPHGIAVRADSRRLADDGDIEMGDAAAASAHPVDREGQKFIRERAAPLRIARRKMRADIAFRECAQNGVDQRMQRNVGIRMPRQRSRMRNAHAAEPNVVAFAEGMYIISGRGADIGKSRHLGRGQRGQNLPAWSA